jgi:hypothetical protein
LLARRSCASAVARGQRSLAIWSISPWPRSWRGDASVQGLYSADPAERLQPASPTSDRTNRLPGPRSARSLTGVRQADRPVGSPQGRLRPIPRQITSWIGGFHVSAKSVAAALCPPGHRAPAARVRRRRRACGHPRRRDHRRAAHRHRQPFPAAATRPPCTSTAATTRRSSAGRADDRLGRRERDRLQLGGIGFPRRTIPHSTRCDIATRALVLPTPVNRKSCPISDFGSDLSEEGAIPGA